MKDRKQDMCIFRKGSNVKFDLFSGKKYNNTVLAKPGFGMSTSPDQAIIKKTSLNNLL